MPDADLQAALFEDFDPAEIAAIEARYRADMQSQGEAKALKRSSRHEFRRAKAEATLAELLPARIPDGESWHVISHGDIDALSYLRHVLAHTHCTFVLISTWCIAREDMAQLHTWLDSGRIEELCAGEIFPSQYGDEYAMALRLEQLFGARLIISRNHSKVTLAANATDAYYLAIESSANVNTNPHIEQTCIHADRTLFEFYRAFYHGLRSIDKRPPL